MEDDLKILKWNISAATYWIQLLNLRTVFYETLKGRRPPMETDQLLKF